MPTFGCGEPVNLSPHLAYYAAKARAKGANSTKAERWADRMVRKRGKRAPVPRKPWERSR